MKAWFLTATIFLLLTSCKLPSRPADKAPSAGDTIAARVQEKMVTDIYSGVIPCGDCPGIVVNLQLTHGEYNGDGHYLLKKTFLERNVVPTIDSGNYTTLRGNAKDENATVFELNPDDSTRYDHYLKNPDGSLSCCFAADTAPDPEISFRLYQLKAVPVVIEGMLSMANAHLLFSECGSSAVYRVEMKCAYQYVAGVYSFQSKNNPGKPMFVRVEGVTEAVKDSINKSVPGIVVTNLISFDTKKNCK